MYQLNKIVAEVHDQESQYSIASTALQLFRDNCFKFVQDRVQNAIFGGLQRDRDNKEGVELALVKLAIEAIVTIAAGDKADILLQGVEYVWTTSMTDDLYFGTF